MKKKVFVVGAGPAGMMAAITAAREGANVTLLEHNDRVGKKILSTGNGRCNFTNMNQDPMHYRSDNEGFAWAAIKAFPVEATVAFFEELGIYARNKNGGLYPYSEQAAAILDVLRMELEHCKIQVITGEHIKEIKKSKNGFQILGQHSYTADAVVLAAGSKAAAKLGSDGSGYLLAKQMGHTVVPVVPALVQLRCAEKFYKALAGVRLQGKVSLYIDGNKAAEDMGEIQLTDYGISGIPVFQVSRFASRAIYEKRKVTAVLDFMPDFTELQFRNFLKERMGLRPEKCMEDFFTGLLNKKVSQVVLKIGKISNDRKAGSLNETELTRIVKTVKQFQTVVIGTNPFEQAQICAGGIQTKEINPDNMESRKVSGFYFAGEIVDVDGICGGYNLQWAWSSGYLAGKGAAHA